MKLREKTACSGKCSGRCSKGDKLWVAAASHGMIALFKKQADGHVKPLHNGASQLAPIGGAFTQLMQDAQEHQQFDQLILVGSPGDLAWVQSLLPAAAQGRVVAEIQYPLMADWLRQYPTQPTLANALEQVFKI